MISHPGGTRVGALVAVVGLTLAIIVAPIPVALLVIPPLVGLGGLLLGGLTIWLSLLLRLIYGVQNTKVVFRMLKEGFRRHPVATTSRVSTELEVLFEKLLGGAADADFRPVAVENVVTIERNSAARVMADRRAAGSATAATIAARAMVAATHALHVHTIAAVLSHYR